MSRRVRFERVVASCLNPFFRWWAGGSRRPVFYDVATTRPELLRIDEAYEAIREELLGVLPELPGMERYHEVDPKQVSISAADERNWRVYFPLRHRDRCPRTSAVVESIPGVLQAFFSILEPRKCVPAHEGPGLYYLRYHTAFVVPRERPPTIRIKDRFHTWKEGESMLFDDSWEHEVMNEADSVRVVLITDFLRPMPWPLSALNRLWWRARRSAQVAAGA